MDRQAWLEHREVVLKRANQILLANPIYDDYKKSLRNWNYLIKHKKGICEVCGKIGKTDLHHKDKSIKPKKLLKQYHSDIRYVPNEILFKGADSIVEYFLETVGVENIIQSTRYYGVDKSEVEELCRSCHEKKHRR